MKKETQIDRKFQGQNEVVITDLPKSAFNLTHNNYFGGLVLGRLIPIVYQWLMPNDKFSGSNQHQLTFEQLATPVLSDVNVSMHNFYATLRSVDKDLPALLTPTKLNSMSAAGSTPRFSVAGIMKQIMTTYFMGGTKGGQSPLYYNNVVVTGSGASALVKPAADVVANDFYSTNRGTDGHTILTFPLRTALAYSYADDVLVDLSAKLDVILNGWRGATNADACLEFNRQFIRTIVDFFCGQGSMLDYFGYPIINHAIADMYADLIYAGLSVSTGTKRYSSNFANRDFALNAPLVNEYPLRIMFAIWTEYYRNVDVEPLTNQFPDYHTWGATALPLDTLVQLLVTRPRSWSADPFIAAGIDDISRHVFAPIVNSASYPVGSVAPTLSGGDLSDRTKPVSDSWSQLTSTYVDSDGTKKGVIIPLPAGIMSAFAQTTRTSFEFGLELNALRKANMIENYLKRMHYGGDEYRDRMLNIYGSRIEDYRINRPELLSSSFDSVAVRQEVANTGAKPTPAGASSSQVTQGERMATATASTEGSDGFTSFSTEFGMYIGILSIMPRAQYDPMCMQLAIAKTFEFPAPQFANSMEETIQTIEMARSVSGMDGDLAPYANPFGFAPYAHAWRSRVDAVHGQYLDEKFDYSFARFWRNISIDSMPKLNHHFLHCHPRLDMFVNTTLLDGQVYGVGKHNFLVERVLPTPVETI